MVDQNPQPVAQERVEKVVNPPADQAPAAAAQAPVVAEVSNSRPISLCYYIKCSNCSDLLLVRDMC